MDKFNALMQRKFLGIKLLYYTAALVVGLAFIAWKMKSSGVPEDQVTEPDSDTGATDPGSDATGTGTDTDGTGTVSSGGTGGTVPDTSTGGDSGGGDSGGGDSGGGTEETNDTWARNAINFLIAGGASVQSSTSAIQKYLAGDQLSYAEGQLKDKAVKKFGLPPDIPPVGGTAKKPTTPVKQTKHVPPAVHKVTGSGDNTYTELAKLYYKSSADQWVDLIQAANTRLPHSGPLKKGTHVIIPAKHNPVYYTARKGKTTATAIASANGISVAALHELNDKTHFPVLVGRRVRVR